VISAWTPQDLPTGSIIGAVDLISCTRMAETALEHQDDQDCGNWSPKRYAWRRGAFITLPVPIPCRGFQSIFEVRETEELVREIASFEHRRITEGGTTGGSARNTRSVSCETIPIERFAYGTRCRAHISVTCEDVDNAAI
jgi:hypothetical protein